MLSRQNLNLLTCTRLAILEGHRCQVLAAPPVEASTTQRWVQRQLGCFGFSQRQLRIPRFLRNKLQRGIVRLNVWIFEWYVFFTQRPIWRQQNMKTMTWMTWRRKARQKTLSKTFWAFTLSQCLASPECRDGFPSWPNMPIGKIRNAKHRTTWNRIRVVE